MSNLLIKETPLGFEKIFPKNYILNLKDKDSGKLLSEILRSFNMLFLTYTGNKSDTRKQVPMALRHAGLWITYIIDKTVITEWYNSTDISDTTWGSDDNWREGSNMLIGDISISKQGTWVINGEDTGISPQGPKGDSPIIRIFNNKILVSYDKGISYRDLNNTPVYTQFRFNADTNTHLVSYDLGKTWQDILPDKVYYKFKYNESTNTYQVSTDFGKTWSNVSAEKVIYKFRYNPETNTHQVSTDLGKNWIDISNEKVFYKFRTNENKLQVSTDLGSSWEDCSELIAAWFRWAKGDTTDSIGKLLISRDELKTWTDLSPNITNNLYIKGYKATVGDLPTSTAALGDIYMVGPTYDEDDTTHDYPHYRMWVKLSDGWVDNGEYLSFQAGVVLELGNNENTVISQKIVSSYINKYNLLLDSYYEYNNTLPANTYIIPILIIDIYNNFYRLEIIEASPSIFSKEITYEDGTLSYETLAKSDILYTPTSYNKKIKTIKYYKIANTKEGKLHLKVYTNLQEKNKYIISTLNLLETVRDFLVIKVVFNYSDSLYNNIYYNKDKPLQRGYYKVIVTLQEGTVSKFQLDTWDSSGYKGLTEKVPLGNLINIYSDGTLYRVRLVILTADVVESGIVSGELTRTSDITITNNILDFFNENLRYSDIKASSFSDIVDNIINFKSLINIPIFRYGESPAIIQVNDLNDFNNILTTINLLIESSRKNILVLINNGTFQFQSNHINILNRTLDVNLSIIGNGKTNLIGNYLEIGIEEAIEYESDYYVVPISLDFTSSLGFIDLDYNSIDIYNTDSWKQLSEVAILDDVSNGIYKMKIDSSYSELSELRCTNVSILISKSWEAIEYKVVKITEEDGIKYVYFTSTLATNIVNYEYTKLGFYAKYKFINLPNNESKFWYEDSKLFVPYKFSTIRIISSSTFLNIYNSELNNFKLSNISFIGNSKGPLLLIQNTKFVSCYLSNNLFIGIKGYPIRVLGTEQINATNIKITHNLFNNCYHYGVYFNKYTDNIEVNNNIFNKIGKGWNLSAAIYVISKNFYIANNKITDFTVNGITAVGIDSKNNINNAELYSTGLIEDNIIKFTNTWYLSYLDNTLNDSGAIYIGALAKNVIIRYNTITNYINKYLFVGIYLDWGTHNVSVFGNIILPFLTGYSLFSLPYSNAGANTSLGKDLIFIQNIVNAPSRLYGNDLEIEKSSYLEQNIFLRKYNDINITTYNVNIGNGDITLPYISYGETIVLQQKIVDSIKSIFNWKQSMLKHILSGY